MKLLFVANRTGNESDSLNQPPIFHLLRRYRGPEYCGPVRSRNAATDRVPCMYYLWLALNASIQYPRLVYTNGTFGVYEMTLSTNNSFESGDILGVYYPSYYTSKVHYQGEGAYCDTLGDITIHLSGGIGSATISYPCQDPVLPYIAIETGQQIFV